jgi:Mce-associated membrane protein
MKPKLGKVFAPVRTLFAVLVRGLKAVPSAVSRLVNRIYDAVVADPVRATKVLGIVTGAVVVLAGLAWFLTDRYERTGVASVEAADTAQNAVVSLLSYNYRSIDRQVAKTADMRTGKFADEYAQFINGQVAPTAKDKQIAVQTAVDEIAVIDAGPGEVELLMYVEQQSESKLAPGGETSTSTLKVRLESHDGKWKVSELNPV